MMNLILHGSLFGQLDCKLWVIKTKADDINKTLGNDYMNMVPTLGQSVQAGKSVDLSCTSDEKISKCFFYEPNKLIRYEMKPGFDHQNGRIQCLCDVRLNFFIL